MVGRGRAPRFLLSNYVPDRQDVWIDTTSVKGPLTEEEIAQGKEFADYPGLRIERYWLRQIKELNGRQRKRLATLLQIITNYELADEADLTDEDYANYEDALRRVTAMMLIQEDHAQGRGDVTKPIEPEVVEQLQTGACSQFVAMVTTRFFEQNQRWTQSPGARGFAASVNASGVDGDSTTRTNPLLERMRRMSDYIRDRSGDLEK